MKTKICFLFLSFFLPLSLLGQFEEGYVIDNQGIKIEGQIDYRNWEFNPKLIEFKKEKEIRKFSPKDIKAFGINSGEVYESYTLDIERLPRRSSSFNKGTEAYKEKLSVFLKLEYRSEFSLFSYKDIHDQVHFFIQKERNTPEELIYRKYFTLTETGNDVVKEEEIYKGQLNIYLRDCPLFHKEINKFNFRQKDLLKLLKKYDSCTGKVGTAFIAKIENVKPQIYLLAGSSFSSLRLKGKGIYGFYDPDLSVNGGGAIALNIVFPRNNGRWALYNELNIKNTNFSKQFSYFPVNSIEERAEVNLKVSYL